MGYRKLLIAVLSCTAFAVGTAQYPFMRLATISRESGTVTVDANDARPLLQVISALEHEYGWKINYEDPPYSSSYDTVDLTVEMGLDKPGVRHTYRMSGGKFTTSFEEGSLKYRSSDEGKFAILSKVIADYNAGNNPGHFELVKTGGGKFSVVGRGLRNESGAKVNTSAILDTVISLPRQDRTLLGTFVAIVREINSVNGPNAPRVTFGETGNVLHQVHVEIGGDNMSARELIDQAIAAAHLPRPFPIAWSSLYEVNMRVYFLNF